MFEDPKPGDTVRFNAHQLVCYTDLLKALELAQQYRVVIAHQGEQYELVRVLPKASP